MKNTNEYMDKIHRIGRISVIGTIIIMVGIPLIISYVYNTFPGIIEIMRASAGLLAIMVPITISEVFSYTPVLGSSIYLTLITGNVLNLKLPVAMNSISLLNLQQGTEKSDVITSIAIAVSSLATISIIALGAALMVPLRPLLLSSPVQTASHYILPALFGALSIGIVGKKLGGGFVSKDRLKGGVVPAILMIIAYFLSPQLVTQLQGVLILVILPITYFGTKYLYRKGFITVEEKSDIRKVKSN